MNKTLRGMGVAGTLVTLLTTGCGSDVNGTISTNPQYTPEGIVLTIQDAKIPNKTHTVRVVDDRRGADGSRDTTATTLGDYIERAIETAKRKGYVQKIGVDYPSQSKHYPKGTTIPNHVYLKNTGGRAPTGPF